MPSTAAVPAGQGPCAALPGLRPAPLERSRIAWVGCEDGHERPLPLADVHARSGAAWPGVRVEETRCGPGELPEGYVPSHVVVLNLQRAIRTETRWAGERDRSEVIIPAGRATVFPAGAPYVTRWRDPLENVMVEISPQFVSSVASDDGAAVGAQLRPELGADDPFLAHLVLAFRELVRGGAPGGTPYAEALGTTLAVHLLRRYGTSAPRHAEPRGGLSPTHFRRIAAYVDGHLAEAISLHALAAEVGMSVYHFARMFRARAGVAPHRYVLERRVERAKALLHGTRLPLGEIALQCGFSHPSHFASTFQRVLGTTPKRYRQLGRDG